MKGKENDQGPGPLMEILRGKRNNLGPGPLIGVRRGKREIMIEVWDLPLVENLKGLKIDQINYVLK